MLVSSSGKLILLSALLSFDLVNLLTFQILGLLEPFVRRCLVYQNRVFSQVMY